uniref:Putative ovule protein n=1 Tax=Solanum chacoense TaxID=4108 RepID=A0A0V0HER6_SOLCH
MQPFKKRKKKLKVSCVCRLWKLYELQQGYPSPRYHLLKSYQTFSTICSFNVICLDAGYKKS